MTARVAGAQRPTVLGIHRYLDGVAHADVGVARHDVHGDERPVVRALLDRDVGADVERRVLRRIRRRRADDAVEHLDPRAAHPQHSAVGGLVWPGRVDGVARGRVEHDGERAVGEVVDAEDLTLGGDGSRRVGHARGRQGDGARGGGGHGGSRLGVPRSSQTG